jgi:hypothetical protein
MKWNEQKMDDSILFRYFLQPATGKFIDALDRITGKMYGKG